jgi:hypothetical protein
MRSFDARTIPRTVAGLSRYRAAGLLPWTLLLVYGRIPLGRAVLRGRVPARGRRPWLGLRFKTLFFNP